jgi:hypothetical protein
MNRGWESSPTHIPDKYFLRSHARYDIGFEDMKAKTSLDMVDHNPVYASIANCRALENPRSLSLCLPGGDKRRFLTVHQHCEGLQA